jgi:CelD/BcsL family acetyltransferase involved in cellulose biosynthesis
MGNYPFVAARVLEHGSPATALAADTPVELRMIDSEAAFSELAAGWDVLVRAMPRPSPFLLHGWLTEWLRWFGDECELAVQAAFRGDRLIAALPLVTHSRHGRTVATFLGGRLSAPADVLLADDEDPALVALLAERAMLRHDYADLFGLSRDCRLAAACDPGALHLFERVDAPVLDLSRGWEETYRAKTSAKARSHHRRRRRQLAEAGKVNVSAARTEEELAPAFEDALRLHKLRWQGRPDGSGFVTPAGELFNRGALGALAAVDAARIVTLTLDGRAIAFVYYIAFEQRMFLYRVAFDPAYGRFSPGVITLLDALEAADGEGLTRLEYLGGPDRYKLDFADGFEPFHLGLGLAGSTAGKAVVATRVRWLRLREQAKRSKAVRLAYDGVEPLRRRLTPQRDVSRPSGVRRRGE